MLNIRLAPDINFRKTNGELMFYEAKQFVSNHLNLLRLPLIVAMALSAPCSFANYSCTGAVGYLGIDAGGDVTVALAGSTPIHKICNVVAQGPYITAVPSCKAMHATLLSARLTGKTITIYYNENGANCGTLPSWATVPGVYFVQGPD